MAGPGGGPSRRSRSSHTKSRKGCKTCKRRHIRCDETFPHCEKCKKHQVRCDYMDSSPGLDDAMRSNQPTLPCSKETEALTASWYHTGQFPFPNLSIYPPIQHKNMTKNELRLISSICAVLDNVYKHGTEKLTLWADMMPKVLNCATMHHFVMVAVQSFAAHGMAYESKSTEARALASWYGDAAWKGLHEAVRSDMKPHADAILSSRIVLALIQVSWPQWVNITRDTRSAVSAMQTAGAETIFGEHLAQYAVDPFHPFPAETAYPLTGAETHDRLEVLAAIRVALGRLVASVPPAGRDRRHIDELASYCDTLKRSPLPQSPREQFDVLYHFRKLLLWAPVSLLSGGRLEASTLVTLAHLYGAALAMEPVFPDVGAAFLGGLAAAPLAHCVSRAQAYAESDEYAASAAAIASLMEFPRQALEAWQRRREWAQRDALQLPRPQGQQTSQQQTPQQQQQQQAQGGQQFDLGNLPLDLNAVGSEYAYTPSLSPAFPSSSITLAPTPTPTSATPPFLTVPSSVDPFGFAAYTSAAASSSSFAPQQLVTTAGYTVASPALVSPAFPSPFEADAAVAAAAAFHQMSHAAYSPSLLSTADTGSIAASDAGSTTSPEHSSSSLASAFPMYGLPQSQHQQHQGYEHGAGIAGGCVAPVAIWT